MRIVKGQRRKTGNERRTKREFKGEVRDDGPDSLLEAFDRVVASFPPDDPFAANSSPSAPRLPRRKRWWSTRAR